MLNCIVSVVSSCCVVTPRMFLPPKMPSARALQIARSQQTKTFELRGALGLARLYIRNDRVAAVSEVLAPVFVDFAAGQDLVEIKEAQELLDDGSS